MIFRLISLHILPLQREQSEKKAATDYNFRSEAEISLSELVSIKQKYNKKKIEEEELDEKLREINVNIFSFFLSG